MKVRMEQSWDKGHLTRVNDIYLSPRMVNNETRGITARAKSVSNRGNWVNESQVERYLGQMQGHTRAWMLKNDLSPPVVNNSVTR
jgi:hypothetical protein